MMIEVENLTKTFGVITAVDGVSFSVDRREIVGFLGPNGAGKTTTMRVLACYLPPTSGKARVAGFDCVNQSLDVRRRVGYLPENVPLYPEMRVREYLNFRAKLKDVPRRQRAGRIDECMRRCRITDVQRQLAGTLSKGYRQRVGLAEAMIHDPDILILDEPTVGLDPIQIRETRGLIKELGQSHTILLSTHILPEVEMLCDRVLIIAQGKVTLEDRLENMQREAVVSLEVRGPQERVRNVLESIEGVAQVQPVLAADGLAAFDIECVDGRDLREAISERMARNGWALRELRLRQVRTLEERFIDASVGELSGE